MRAAIYCRKSTEQNGVADDVRSVARQEADCRRFVGSRDGWSVADVYVDDAVSGALFQDRPGLQRLLRDAQAGAFDALVAYDLDRLGRHTQRTRQLLYDLADRGIEVWLSSTGQRVDLDSMEGGIITDLTTRFAQWERDKARTRTRAGHRRKAELGYIVGSKLFGFDNVRGDDKNVHRRINEAEAAIVRDIFSRFAHGETIRQIALRLNEQGILSPRGHGWGISSVRSTLANPYYRGERIWGRSRKAYGRELGQRTRGRFGRTREQGQIAQPDESQWVRGRTDRIIDAEVLREVDARLSANRARWLQSVERGGRHPERAHGTYLLSGGMLVCPVCDGHLEAHRGCYVCSTRRRMPGCCHNLIELPIDWTDHGVLNVLEGTLLVPAYVDELVASVATPQADPTARLEGEREKLRGEIDNLVRAVAGGSAPASVLAAIEERERRLARIESELRQPRPANIDQGRLRAALTQRIRDWREALRGETKVARLVVRRLIGPITVWEEEPFAPLPKEFRKYAERGLEHLTYDDVSMPGATVRWEAPTNSGGGGLLRGLVQDGLSSAGSDVATDARRPAARWNEACCCSHQSQEESR